MENADFVCMKILMLFVGLISAFSNTLVSRNSSVVVVCEVEVVVCFKSCGCGARELYD